MLKAVLKRHKNNIYIDLGPVFYCSSCTVTQQQERRLVLGRAKKAAYLVIPRHWNGRLFSTVQHFDPARHWNMFHKIQGLFYMPAHTLEQGSLLQDSEPVFPCKGIQFFFSFFPQHRIPALKKSYMYNDLKHLVTAVELLRVCKWAHDFSSLLFIVWVFRTARDKYPKALRKCFSSEAEKSLPITFVHVTTIFKWSMSFLIKWKLQRTQTSLPNKLFSVKTWHEMYILSGIR